MIFDKLYPGRYLVRHPQRETPFMLSVVRVYGLTAVHGYEIGEKPPRRGKHLTPTAVVRNWIDKLQLEPNQNENLPTLQPTR